MGSFVDPFITVIMPAYNEQENLENSVLNIHEILKQLGYQHEIIVIDDGSKDETRKIALKLSNYLPVKVLGYERNMGKGYAFKCGANLARGNITLLMDSDGEVKPLDLKKYIYYLKEADVIIASKRHPNSVYIAPFMRKILGTGFHLLTKLLTGVKVSDTQSGLKAFRTRELKRLLPLLSVKRYAFDVELLVVASLMKLRVRELPIKIQMGARFSLRQVIRMLVDLLGIVYRLRVKRWYQYNLNNRKAKYKPLIKW